MMKISVYYTRIDDLLPDNLLQRALSAIPPHIQTSITRYRNKRDQWLTLSGKLLLLHALKQICPPVNLTIDDVRLTSFDRPYFDHPIDFNISHSGQYSILGITRAGKIGIDIEHIQPINSSEIKDVFTPNEWQQIQNDGKGNQMFYNLWTRKEAIIKATGKGLNMPLNTFDVTGRSLSVENERYELSEIKIDNDYSAHIASNFIPQEEINLCSIDIAPHIMNTY